MKYLFQHSVIANSGLTIYLIGSPMYNVEATFASGNGIKQCIYVSTIRLFDFHLPIASTLSLEHPFRLAYVASSLRIECVAIGCNV